MTLFRELERSLCSLVKNERFALPNQRNFSGFRVSAGGSCCRLANNPLHAQHISHYRKHIELSYRANKFALPSGEITR